VIIKVVATFELDASCSSAKSIALEETDDGDIRQVS